MPKEKGLSQEQQQAFDYYYGEKANDNSARLYQEWLALNSHSASQLKAIRGKLAFHDQARSRRQRWRTLWQLWRQSGFSSLTYYRNLIKFEELLLQFNKAYQSRIQSQKAQESKLAHAGNYETVGGRTTSLVKTPYEKALVRLLNNYSAQLEGAFSKIKRYMRFIWRHIMIARTNESQSEAESLRVSQPSDSKSEHKSEPLRRPAEQAAMLPQKQEPSVGIFGRIWNNLARKWRITSRKYDYDSLQELFSYNLKKMQGLIPPEKYSGEASDRFTALCKARVALETSYARYKERYQPGQWKLKSKADESRRNEQIKGMNVSLDKVYNEDYETALRWLFPELQKLFINQLRTEFEIFKLDPNERCFNQLKARILELKKRVLSQVPAKKSFYDNHLRLLMRQSLNDIRGEFLGMAALFNSPLLNQLIHWLEDEEKSLLEMVVPARVDENVKLFAQLDITEISLSYDDATNDIGVIYANRRCGAQKQENKEEKNHEEREWEIPFSDGKSILALQRRASKTAADIEKIWLEHRWDESDPETAAWKKETLSTLARKKTKGSDETDKVIEEGSAKIAQWVGLQRSLVTVKNNENYLWEIKKDDFLYYVFVCSFFGLKWDGPLTSHDIDAAYRSFSLVVHSDRVRVMTDAIVISERDKLFNRLFKGCKRYHNRLIDLFKDRERLFQIKEVTSPWDIAKHVLIGTKNREEIIISEVKEDKEYLNKVQALVMRIEENTKEAESDREETERLLALAALKDKQIADLERQLAAAKAAKTQSASADQQEEKSFSPPGKDPRLFPPPAARASLQAKSSASAALSPRK